MIAQNQEWIRQGLYVDAKDKHGDWQAGLVLAVTKVHIKIRFDGWVSKLDQTYPLNTQRIKPFRSITKGYTGQKKSSAVREHWTFNLENLQFRLAQFEQFVSHISEKSGFEINQYLRGENYFYIDFLMNQTYCNTQQIIKVYAYFKANFEFVKTYFQQFYQRDTNVWFQAGEKQQLTAKKVYIDLHYEIFDSVISMTGSLPRTTVFIKNNERLLKELSGSEMLTYDIFIRKELNTIQFFNAFENVITKILNQTKNGLRNVPYTFISSLYSLLVGLEKKILIVPLKQKINGMFIDIMKQYMGSLTVQDAKTNERTIEDILCAITTISNRIQADKEEICRWAEKAKLKLWIFLIQSDVLEKKLRGIHKIRDFYQQIHRKMIFPMENSIVMCTKPQFRQWLTQEQLIKIIFQTNEHSEIIKKGCEMVQTFYASKHPMCTIQDVIYIWYACFKKHEAIKKIIFQFWNDFAEYVTADNDWKLFVEVLIKNEQQINEDWEIESLFGFLRSIKSDDQNQSVCDVILMMYRKTCQNQKYIPEFAKELSFFDGDGKILQQLIDNCLTQISEKNEPIFHIKLLARLYMELHNHRPYIPEKIIVVLIEELKDFVKKEENEKFVHTIFNLFNEIMSAKDRGVSAGNPNGVKFTFENFESLWEIFTNCQINQFKKFFFGWMASRPYQSSSNFPQYHINSRFNHEFRLEIFSNIFCDDSKFNYKKIEPYEFAVFKEFLIYANFKGGSFESRSYNLGTSHQSQSRRVLRTKSKDVQGQKELWEIFKNCENDDVVVSSSTFLKDIYLRVSNTMSVQQKTERIKSLMQIIQTSISEGQRNGCFTLIKRILILISKLLTEIKEKIEIPKEFQRQQKTQKQTVTAFISPNEMIQVQIHIEEPFINLKSEIARKFLLPRDQFTIFNGKHEILREFYDLPYYILSSEDHSLRIVKTGNQIGRYVMTNVCQHIYHKLIHFLKNQHVCMEAFHLLEYLDIFEPVRLFENLQQEIQEVHEIIKNKKKLYLHIFFTRVFAYVLEKEIAQIDGQVLQKMISHLQIPIQSNLIVSYLQKLVQIINAIVNNQSPTIKKDPESPVSLNSYRPKLYKLLLHLVKYMNKNSHQISSHEMKLFTSSLSLYMNVFDSPKLLFDSFIKDEHFREFMFEVLIKCEYLQIKKIIENKIGAWLKEGFCSINQERKVAQFFINELYYEIYQKHCKQEIDGAEFVGIFKLFRTVLESVSYETFTEIVYKTPFPIENLSFCNHILNSIKRLSDSSISQNFMLNGQLQIVVGMIKRDRSIISIPFIEFLFDECLIYVHGKTKGMDVKCLFKENISLVLEILWYMMIDINAKRLEGTTRIDELSLGQYTETILSKFREFHYCEDWRSSREWSFDFMELSKTKNDFVGLQNPGCICYLNSLLQQLYMIQDFRSAVLNMTTSKETASSNADVQISTGEEDSPQLIPKLKILFMNLMFSQRSSIDPQFFTSSIRTAGDRPMVKIYEQMDIDEFSMILFDKIQNKLHSKKTPNFIRELFGGTYSNEIISQECNHSSEREEQFLSISLDVKKHITEGFQSLVKGEMLQGENAYFCDGCDKKVKALKRLSIKRLPRQLIISLRRFEFDYEADQKIKINKYCEFPFELNLENFSQDKLNESTLQKRSEQQHSSTSMNEEELPSEKSQKKNNFPPEYFVYKLKGVVVHTGSADSGHYYSFIEGKDGNWFEFNDEKVSEFDVKNLGEEAFGGRDGEYTKIRNAYLLFYERKAKTHFNNHAFYGSDDTINSAKTQEKPSNIMSEEVNVDSAPTNYFQQSLNQQSLKALQEVMDLQKGLEMPQNRQIIQQIVMQNKKIRLIHFFFSKEYLEFVISFIKQALYPISGIKTSDFLKTQSQYEYIMPLEQGVKLVGNQHALQCLNELDDEIFKFLVNYTFLIQLRQHKFFISLELLQAIKNIFFEHPNAEKRFNYIAYFLQEIYHQSFINEFFINCPNKDKSKIVGNFVFETLKLYLAQIPNHEADPFPKMVKNIIKLIMKTVINTKNNITELLIIIRKMFDLRQSHPLVVKQIISFILKKDFVTVLIENLLGLEPSMATQAKRVLNLNNDEDNPVQSQNNSDVKEAVERKNSDLSARDQVEQGTPTKKKHYNEKMEIEGEQKSLDEPRFSVLFGMYPEEAGVAAKSSEKQAWTILYYIQKEIIDKKAEIDGLKDRIKKLKKVSNDENQMSMQGLAKYKKSAGNGIQSDRSPALLTSQKSPQFISSGNSHQNQPVSPASNESTQRMQNSPIEEPEFEGTEEEESEEMASESSDEEYEESEEQSVPSALGEDEDFKYTNQLIEILKNSLPEVVPLPKNILQVNTYPTENNAAQEVPLGSQLNSDVNEVTVTASIPIPKETKRQSPEEEKSPKIQNPNKPNIVSGQNQQNINKPIPQVQLTPQQQQELALLQKHLVLLEKQFHQINTKFNAAVSNIKSDKLMKIISEQKDTKSIIALATFASNFIFNNLDFHQTLLSNFYSIQDAIEMGLKDYESSKYRPFFVIIEKILEVDDDLARKRRFEIFKILRNSFRINEKYFVECDLIHQFMLKYSSKFPVFEAFMRENPHFINEIKNWITQKRTPGIETIKKNRLPNCQRRPFRLHGIVVSGEMKEYESLSAYKFDSFEKIKHNRFISSIKYPQEPKVGEMYKKGDLVDVFFDNGMWTAQLVEENYFGIIQVQTVVGNKYERLLLSEDDEKIKLKETVNIQERPQKMEIEQ